MKSTKCFSPLLTAGVNNYFATADRLLLMKDKILTELQGDARKQATKDSSKAIH